MSQGILQLIFCDPSCKLHPVDGEKLHIILLSVCNVKQESHLNNCNTVSISWSEFIIRNVNVISVHLQWIICCHLELQY
jgi:hypothetical protein